MTKPLPEMSVAELNEQIWLHQEMVKNLERRSLRLKSNLLKFETGVAKKWLADETGHGRLFIELVIGGLDEAEQDIETERDELAKVLAQIMTEAKRRGLA
jgi:uncharacterized protein (DUF342 family)